MDVYIRQGIKNWAAQHQPPANARARLLLVAASPAFQQAHSFDRSTDLSQDNWEQGLRTADRSLEECTTNWMWAMHLSYTHIRHVA